MYKELEIDLEYTNHYVHIVKIKLSSLHPRSAVVTARER